MKKIFRYQKLSSLQSIGPLRCFYLSLIHLGWKLIILIVIFHFISSWAMMAFFEPASPMIAPENYLWFYAATSTTVGYGDFTPNTMAGRLVGIYIMIGGIGFFAAFIANIAREVFNVTQQGVRGLMQLNEQNHCVILGYHPNSTKNVIHEILADPIFPNRQIVLCSKNIEQNPISNKNVKFVHGSLNSTQVMEHACVATADKVIIYAGSDDLTITAALAVSAVACKNTHIVAYLEQIDNIVHIKRVNPDIECIQPYTAELITQAMQDPGITNVLEVILSNNRLGGTLFRVDIPENCPQWRYHEFSRGMLRAYGANIIAIGDSHKKNCQWNALLEESLPVKGGMSFFCIANDRPRNIDWLALT